MNKLRTYKELIRLDSFEERFNYLKIGSRIGDATFGSLRFLNQRFYQRSKEWKEVRRYVIARDLGRDLALEGFDIYDKRDVLIHHMNPIGVEDFETMSDRLLNPEYLITTTLRTHNAIHYGDDSIVKGTQIVNRSKNDTCPWKQIRGDVK